MIKIVNIYYNIENSYISNTVKSFLFCGGNKDFNVVDT